MNLKTFSRKGGKACSEQKTVANRAKAAAFWKAVRSGDAIPPRRYRKPPSASEIGPKLAAYCRRNGIVRLEIFGSVARGDAGPRSDVDLIATFRANPGLAFFGLEEEMGRLLGVPVHLLSRESVETMSNPHRRDSILVDARPIFDARDR